MPPVRAVSQLLTGGLQPDGFQIICATLPTVSVRLATVPTGQRGSIAAAEAWINARLVTLLAGQFQAVVHIVSVSPLNVIVCCANAGVVIGSNWWAGD